VLADGTAIVTPVRPSRLGVGVVLSGAAGAALLLLAVAPAVPAPEAPSFERDVRPLLTASCVACHAGLEPAGKLALDGWGSEAAARAKPDALRSVRARLVAGDMPPKDHPRPARDAVVRALAWLETATASPAAGTAPAGSDPGRVTLRRLNRLEWRNAVRDLVLVDDDSAEGFPSDDVGDGFDVMGDVLSTPPVLLEKVVRAAEKVADEAVVVEDATRPTLRHVEAESATSTLEKAAQGRVAALYTNGDVHATLRIARAGRHVLRARAFQTKAGPDPARLAFTVDGAPVFETAVEAERAKPATYEATVRIERGTHVVGVAFTNDFYDPMNADLARRDRNLFVDWFEVQGPLDAADGLPASHRRVMEGDPGTGGDASRLRAVLARLSRRAWRRPTAPADLDRLVAVAESARAKDEPLEVAVRAGLVAVLVSPRFWFHGESHPRPDDARAVHDLDPFEVASRLSFFLWSSLPDDALLAAAERGTLGRELPAQVRRMLADAKAGALVEGFCDQWLTLRRVAAVAPDRDRFPGFDAALAADAVRETQMFFESVRTEDLPVTAFLTGRFSWLTERLARWYGIEGVSGDRFRRVALEGTDRVGVLTHASVLALTSYPTRTSPVKRGKWVLEQVLASPPPPAPPGAGDLPAAGEHGASGTVRERMVAHRKDPACASCHRRLDPIGFALERFDAVGRRRDLDEGRPVDDSGALPDGGAFRGAAELAALLAKGDAFPRAFAKHLLAYAIGRGVGPEDDVALDRIVASAKARGLRFSAFVEAVVESAPFRRGRGEDPVR
jgi:hypothetical protein